MSELFNKAYCIAYCIALAGCATTTPPPQQSVVSGVSKEVVKVSVLEHCIFVDEIPVRPKLWMTEAQTKEKRRLAAVIDIDEIDEYFTAADTLLRGCAKPRTEAPK